MSVAIEDTHEFGLYKVVKYIRLVVVQVACVLMFYVLAVEVLVNDVWLYRMGHVLQCFLLLAGYLVLRNLGWIYPSSPI